MAEEAPKPNHPPSSTSDLMESAKTVAQAAQLAYTKQTDKIDKAKIAGAAESVLETAKNYGKIDEKSGVGQYVGKAEDYLHQFHSPSDGGKPAAAPTAEKKEAAPAPAPAPEVVEKEEKEKSSGGVGGLMNMAKGLF